MSVVTRERQVKIAFRWLRFQVESARPNRGSTGCGFKYYSDPPLRDAQGKKVPQMCVLRNGHRLNCQRANELFAFDIDTMKGALYSSLCGLYELTARHIDEGECLKLYHKCDVEQAVRRLADTGRINLNEAEWQKV